MTPLATNPATADHLSRAFERLRRQSWGSFDEAMADPFHGRLIRAYAHRLANRPEPCNGPQHLIRRAVGIRLGPAPKFDRKRAASGDTDDFVDSE